MDRVGAEKTRNEFLRDFVYLHARCIVSSSAEEQTSHDALFKFIPILVFFFLIVLSMLKCNSRFYFCFVLFIL